MSKRRTDALLCFAAYITISLNCDKISYKRKYTSNVPPTNNFKHNYCIDGSLTFAQRLINNFS